MNFTTLIILIFTAILAIGSVSKGLNPGAYSTCGFFTIELLFYSDNLNITQVIPMNK